MNAQTPAHHPLTNGADLEGSMTMEHEAARLFRLFVALAWALGAAAVQAQMASIRAATPNGPLYDGVLAELRRNVAGVASVEQSGPASAGEVVAALRRGAIDVAIVPPSALAESMPDFGIHGLAFAFPNGAPDYRYGSLNEALAVQLKEQGLASLGHWYGGTTVIAGTQPLRSPSDFNGARIRFRDSESARQFAGVGAHAVPLRGSNVRPALRNGAIDAVETDWSEVATLAPVLRYVTETDHLFAGHVVVVHIARFSRLSAVAQKVVEAELSSAGSRLKERVLRREFEARDAARRTPGLTFLRLDANLQTEWVMALAPAQEPLIRRIRPEVMHFDIVDYVSKTMSTTSASSRSQSLVWNAWFQTAPRQTAIAMQVGSAYQFRLDLGRLAYPGTLDAFASRRLFDEIGRDPLREEVTLLLRPVLLGDALRPVQGSAFGARVLKIRPDRLTPEPGDAQRLAAAEQGRIALQDLAAALSVGAPVSWDVVARQAGCARIAVSVWDATGVRPLDYLIVDFAIARPGEAAPECSPGVRGGRLVAGLRGLLDTGNSGDRAADAALHLFDVESAGDENPSTVAVYVDRAGQELALKAGHEPVLRAWELGNRLSDFLGQPNKLQQSINQARASFGRADRPYEDVVRQMSATLFGGRTDADRAEAEAAREDMQRMAEADPTGPTPVVLVRYFGPDGQMRYVPLALMSADATQRVLPRRVTVAQPLSGTHRRSAEACFDGWNMAIPHRLDGVPADEAELLLRNDWRTRGERMSWYEDNPALLNFLSSPAPAAARGEALVLLAHHGEGSVTYSSTARPDRILNEEVRRGFSPGSVAVLAACSTTGVSDASRAFVRQLASRGVQAFVVSPFQVDAGFGARLAVNFVAVAGEARAQGATPRIVDLHEQALRRTIAAFEGRPGYRDMALEFQVIGDHELRLCPAPR